MPPKPPSTLRPNRGLVTAGLLLGTGLGGLFDGVVFHQLLQWHGMLSARVPPVSLRAMELNMFWDGVFHAAMWLTTLAGVAVLLRAARAPGLGLSGRVVLGFGLIGWGLFQLVEGIVNHHLLELHHVRESGPDRLVADVVFLCSGVVLAGTGWLLLRSGRQPAARPWDHAV